MLLRQFLVWPVALIEINTAFFLLTKKKTKLSSIKRREKEAGEETELRSMKFMEPNKQENVYVHAFA